MYGISDCGFWSFSEPFDDAYVQNILRLLSSTFPQLIFLGCPPPKHQQKFQFLLTLTLCLWSCWNVALELISMTTQLISHSS